MYKGDNNNNNSCCTGLNINEKSWKNEGKKVFYFVSNKNKFKDKEVCIFGGGDSALDWAIELSQIAKVNLIHRRSEFRGSKHSFEQVKELEKKNKLKIQTPYQPKKLEEKNNKLILTLEDEKNQDTETQNILTTHTCVLWYTV